MIKQRASTAMAGALMLWALAACSTEGSKGTACSAAAGMDRLFGIQSSDGRAEDCGAQASQSARQSGGDRATSNQGSPPADLLPADRTIVTDLQSRLSHLGYDPGPADGQIGPKTRDAIRAYQKKAGMKPDGQLTSSLMERIRADSPS